MEPNTLISVTVTWDSTDGTRKSLTFVARRAVILPELNKALREEVDPTWEGSCSITMNELGPARGALT